MIKIYCIIISNDKFKKNPKISFFMAKKGFLSHNAMDKIMREAGAFRVSDNAKVTLANLLEEKALKISAEAKRLAEHAGRKTVTDKDIELADQH